MRPVRLALITSGVLAAVAAGAPAAAQAAAFREPIAFGTGTTPVSVAVGHFNADGDPDLAVANRGSNNVSVLLGDRSVTFRGPTNFNAGAGPSSVAVGDLNLDSRADLAVANRGSNNVSVLLGNGAGSFQPVGTFGVDKGPRSVAVGEFNGDSRPDLAVANFDSNTVSLLLGRGTGIFDFGGGFSVGQGPVSLAVGDFGHISTGTARDGRLDLVVANSTSGDVRILFFAPECEFGPCQETFILGGGPSSVAVADFDRNARPDVAVTRFDANAVSLLRFAAACDPGPCQSSFRTGKGPTEVATPDFDRDNFPDLLVTEKLSRTFRAITDLDGTGSANVNPIGGAPEDCDAAQMDSNVFPDTACVGTNGGTGFPQEPCLNASVTIEGTDGNDDPLDGTNGDDVILAGDGDDKIRGLGGADKICGGPGNDTLRGRSTGSDGRDTLSGGLGTDTVSYASRTGAVRVDIDGTADDGAAGGAEADNVMTDVEKLIGGSGWDTLIGDADSNTIDGGLGGDTIDGGGGRDTVSYATRSGGVRVILDLQRNDGTKPSGESDYVMRTVENVIGGFGPDELVGNELNNTLTGGGEADILRGLNGNDILKADDDEMDAALNCDGGSVPGTQDIADVNAGDPFPSGCETRQ
jgi:Ca2+-binding RTX toxin-like protein